MMIKICTYVHTHTCFHVHTHRHVLVMTLLMKNYYGNEEEYCIAQKFDGKNFNERIIHKSLTSETLMNRLWVSKEKH